MKVKDLREKLQELPDDMEVVIETTHLRDSLDQPYNLIGHVVRKVKTKLVKEIDGFLFIQSRPKKDDSARLALIIE